MRRHYPQDAGLECWACTVSGTDDAPSSPSAPRGFRGAALLGDGTNGSGPAEEIPSPARKDDGGDHQDERGKDPRLSNPQRCSRTYGSPVEGTLDETLFQAACSTIAGQMLPVSRRMRAITYPKEVIETIITAAERVGEEPAAYPPARTTGT